LRHLLFALGLLGGLFQGGKTGAGRAHIERLEHIHGRLPFHGRRVKVVLLAAGVALDIAEEIILFPGCVFPKEIVGPIIRALEGIILLG
jgi:hypothetical protein